MKVLGGFFVFGILVLVGSLYMQAKLFSDQGVSIQIAFEAVDDRRVELNLVLPVTFPAVDPPRMNDKGKITWEDWIADHFQLYDAGDTVVPLKRSNHCKIIPRHKIVGTEEFFLKAMLEPGLDYVFEYVPKLSKKKRYRYAFTSPAMNTEVQMCAFEPVK